MTLKCPVCKSEKVIFNAGGETGKYECVSCGYLGPLIIDEDDE